jgi:FtsH-binding integral membrane protein
MLVLYAAILTLGVTISLTIYALTTKKDFTMMGGSLFICGIAFILMGILMGLGGYSKPLHILYSALGTILFGFYLIYDIYLFCSSKSYFLFSFYSN